MDAEQANKAHTVSGYALDGHWAKDPTTGRDIFKEGPSPELQAEWDRVDQLVESFKRAEPVTRDLMLERHPELREHVCCYECEHINVEPAPQRSKWTAWREWLRRRR